MILPFMALLAGCTHYPDTCDRRALHELRLVERLIEDTQTNLARGYSYETVETGFRTGFVFCSGTWNAALCAGNDTGYTRQPVAIDPEAEQRKLDSLVQRRNALAATAAECRPA